MIRRRLLVAQAAMMPLALLAVRAQAQPAGGLPYRTDFKVAAAPELRDRLPEQHRTAGTLTVATNPNTPPTIFVAEDNRTLAGREVDVMSAVAHRLGLEPRWVNGGGFGNIVPGLASGRYDAALANLSVTRDRLRQVDFVSYFNSNRLGLVRAAEDAPPQPVSDLSTLCGQTVGAGSGTTNADTLLRQNDACRAAGRSPITVPLFPGRPEGVQAVLSGRVPGFFGPFDGLRYMVSASHGRLAMAGDFRVPNDFVGIGLQKDSALTPLVAAALDTLIRDGTYAAILRRWDLEYGAVSEARINAAILDGGAATPHAG